MLGSISFFLLPPLLDCLLAILEILDCKVAQEYFIEGRQILSFVHFYILRWIFKAIVLALALLKLSQLRRLLMP